MKTTRLRMTAAALVALGAQAVADDETVYLSIDCMQATVPNYVEVEEAIWLPMHQSLVDDGKRESWALYRVVFGDRSECDYYTVTTWRGSAQLNEDIDYREVHGQVHSRWKFPKAMADTWAARRQMSSELWQGIDSTTLTDHRYAVFNWMLAEDPDAYERMESRVFKPAHQALVDSGQRAGWAVYELLSPIGSSVPYNYSTIDFVNNLNPVPMAETMIETHPDRDLEQMYRLLELREYVRSETWERVISTTARSTE